MDTNIWRARFFNTILQDVIESKFNVKRPTQEDNWRKFAELFIDNVDAVTRELQERLQQVAQVQGGFSDQIGNEIFDVAHSVGILSLRMAAQRAHVRLIFAAHGEMVKIGPRFKDV